MNTFPEIITSRLCLNQITLSDVPLIVEYAGNPKVSAMTLNIPHPYSEKDAHFWINMANEGFKTGTQYTFAVRCKNKPELIGGIGLRLNRRFDTSELGYWIGEPHWNQGFASEAVSGILEYGFNNLNLNKIYATHLVENPASGKVMMKNRMIKEGELKEHTKKGGQYKSLIQYRLTKTEFENIK